MTRTEVVLKTSVSLSFSHVTQLLAQKSFIVFSN